MAQRIWKISLKNLTLEEVAAQDRQETVTHLTGAESPALLFVDGTTVRITRDTEGQFVLRISEPQPQA